MPEIVFFVVRVGRKSEKEVMSDSNRSTNSSPLMMNQISAMNSPHRAAVFQALGGNPSPLMLSSTYFKSYFPETPEKSSPETSIKMVNDSKKVLVVADTDTIELISSAGDLQKSDRTLPSQLFPPSSKAISPSTGKSSSNITSLEIQK